jgi:hypothetical protein
MDRAMRVSVYQWKQAEQLPLEGKREWDTVTDWYASLGEWRKWFTFANSRLEKKRWKILDKYGVHPEQPKPRHLAAE